MTKRELLELLKDLPDSTEVYVVPPESLGFRSGKDAWSANAVVRHAGTGLPKVVFITVEEDPDHLNFR